MFRSTVLLLDYFWIFLSVVEDIVAGLPIDMSVPCLLTSQKPARDIAPIGETPSSRHLPIWETAGAGVCCDTLPLQPRLPPRYWNWKHRAGCSERARLDIGAHGRCELAYAVLRGPSFRIRAPTHRPDVLPLRHLAYLASITPPNTPRYPGATLPSPPALHFFFSATPSCGSESTRHTPASETNRISTIGTCGNGI